MQEKNSHHLKYTLSLSCSKFWKNILSKYLISYSTALHSHYSPRINFKIKSAIKNSFGYFPNQLSFSQKRKGKTLEKLLDFGTARINFLCYQYPNLNGNDFQIERFCHRSEARVNLLVHYPVTCCLATVQTRIDRAPKVHL